MFRHRFNLCLIVLVISACDVLEPDGAERQQFENARAAWMRLGLDDYAYTYRRACECRPEWTRPARVVVHSGKVSDAWGADHSLEVASLDYYPTVDRIFNHIKDAFDQGSHRIVITYDRKLFYPTSILIDPKAEVADDEYVVNISELMRMQ